MPKRNVILAAGLLVVAAALVWFSRTPRADKDPLVDVLDLIGREYVRPIDKNEVRRGAYDGMVSQLDPGSIYLPPGQGGPVQQLLQGREVGVGLRLEIVNGQVRVIGPMPGSPAAHAGVCTGDRLMTIDSADVAGLNLREVYRRLAGEAGSSVRLGLFRTTDRQETLSLVREEFAVETIVGLHRDADREWVHLIDTRREVAYLRVREFVTDTSAKLQEVLRRVPQYHAIVLDLRDNPGGPLESAVAVANLFLHSGTIVSVHSRSEPVETYQASADGTYPRKIPVVVLVNDGTASAAEIVSGALWRQDRAVLIGTRTHGKGSLQKLFPLPDSQGQINLTVAEFRIGGTEIISRRKGSKKWGIDPHELVTLLPSSRRRLDRLRLAAQVYRPPGDSLAGAGELTPEAMAEQLMKLDLQLARAMEILRSPRQYQSILRRAAAARAAREAGDDRS